MSTYIQIIFIYSNMLGTVLAQHFYIAPMILVFCGGWLYFWLKRDIAKKQHQQASAKWLKFREWLEAPTIEGAQEFIKQYGINTEFYTPPNHLVYSDPTGQKMVRKDGGIAYTLLLAACSKNNLSLVEYLLEQGADPNQLDQNALLIMLNRTKINYLPVIRTLILHGMTIHADLWYYTPEGVKIQLNEYSMTLKTAVDEKAHFEEILSEPKAQTTETTDTATAPAEPKKKKQKL